MSVLRLQSCWEVTNHGLVNIGDQSYFLPPSHFYPHFYPLLLLLLIFILFSLNIHLAVHSLPNLTILSLSGCSKITDDGIELIAENLRKLVGHKIINIKHSLVVKKEVGHS